MTDDPKAFLDDEGSEARWTPEMREEARAWERLAATLREDAPGPAPSWIETRVMAQVRAEGRVGGEGFLGWLLRPREMNVSPLVGGAVLATVAVLALVPWLGLGPEGATQGAAGAPPDGSRPDAAVVYVQFVFEAPGARSVAVAGDFNEWDQRHRLADPDGDGVWIGRVPLLPGVHHYMFIVDGERWVTDPRAERYVDDGFGNRNAVLAIAAPGRI